MHRLAFLGVFLKCFLVFWFQVLEANCLGVPGVSQRFLGFSKQAVVF